MRRLPLFVPIMISVSRYGDPTQSHASNAANPSHIHGVLIAKVAVFLQSLVDDFFELGRNLRVDPHRRHGWAFQNGVEDHSRGVYAEQQPPRGHLLPRAVPGLVRCSSTSRVARVAGRLTLTSQNAKIVHADRYQRSDR